MNTSGFRITVALALSLVALLGIYFVIELPDQGLPVHASPGTLYVAPDGDDLKNCSSLANRCRTVQRAVDVAVTSDEIRVASGIYTDVNVRPRQDITSTGVVTQVVYISKTVTIRGGYSADFATWNPTAYLTTLDASNLGRVLYITGNISPTVEGLRITGGNAAGMTGYSYYGMHDVGGGVYVITAAATLDSNQILTNTAPYGGGGVSVVESNAKIRHNTIASNTVALGGGGVFLYNSTATLEGNIIVSNTSPNLGGGLYLFDSNATLTGNTIAFNRATAQAGGVDVASCNPTLSGNIIAFNTAGYAGGLLLWYSNSLLTNNVIADNRADTTGSGLWIGGSSPRLLHTTITRNAGSASSAVYVTDDGSGSFSAVAMTNTIIVSHTTGILANTGSSAILNGVLWYSNTTNYGGVITATNAITGNPGFALDGYHLTADSKAINAGVSAGVTSDIDGDPRPIGLPDLGADEWMIRVFLPVVLRG